MSTQTTIDPKILKDSVDSLNNDGFVILDRFLSEDMRKRMFEIASTKLSNLLEIAKGKDIGIGAKNGKAILNIGQPWEGGHQKIVKHDEIRNDLNFNFVEEQEIDIISIDSFISEGRGPVPDYLKIDIDGSEMPFLKGAVNTFQDVNLKGIIFELNETDPNFSNIIDFLDKNGFFEEKRFNVPNEPNLYNIIFLKN